MVRFVLQIVKFSVLKLAVRLANVRKDPAGFDRPTAKQGHHQHSRGSVEVLLLMRCLLLEGILTFFPVFLHDVLQVR